MADITDRLSSAFEKFLNIHQQPSELSTTLVDFHAEWQTLYNEAFAPGTSTLDESTSDFAFDIADTIEALCGAFQEVDIAHNTIVARMDDEHEMIRQKYASSQSRSPLQTPSRSVSRQPSTSSYPSPASSKSPSPSRKASPSRATKSKTRSPSPRKSPKPQLPPVSTKSAPSGLPSPARTDEAPSPVAESPAEANETAPAEAERKDDRTDTEEVIQIATPPSSPSPRPTLPLPKRVPSATYKHDYTKPIGPYSPYVLPTVKWMLKHPGNPFPPKHILQGICQRTQTERKDLAAWLTSTRARLGWTRLRKVYFADQSKEAMVTWAEGYWRIESLMGTGNRLAMKDVIRSHEGPDAKLLTEWEDYLDRGIVGGVRPSGAICALKVELERINTEVRQIHEKMNLSRMAQVIDDTVRVVGKEEVTKLRFEEEEENTNLRKRQREEEQETRRVRQRAASQPTPSPTLKRSRDESEGVEPQAKRHCSVPTLALHTPAKLLNWFAPDPWPIPENVQITPFVYGYDFQDYGVPDLSDDSGSESGSIGPSTPVSTPPIGLPFSLDVPSLPLDLGFGDKSIDLPVPNPYQFDMISAQWDLSGGLVF
uniref:Putative homeodomain 1 protein n=1 Tax=Flammulina velutipes TaxID=38945 RepID=F1CZK2_FLAVE|nr:putative homeodomain 1 protein [Flammulina velutipes]